MANNQRKFWIGQFAIHHVQIGTAHGASQHLELYLMVLRFLERTIAEDEGFAGLI
jgi:hypothetical protein